MNNAFSPKHQLSGVCVCGSKRVSILSTRSRVNHDRGILIRNLTQIHSIERRNKIYIQRIKLKFHVVSSKQVFKSIGYWIRQNSGPADTDLKQNKIEYIRQLELNIIFTINEKKKNRKINSRICWKNKQNSLIFNCNNRLTACIT